MNTNEIVTLFAEESVLKFANGEEVKGAKAVTDVILRCCEEYHAGWVDGVKTATVRTTCIVASVGLVAAASVFVAKKVMKSRQKPVELDLTQNEEEKEAE